MKNTQIILLFFVLSIFIGCQKKTSKTVVTAIPALESILLELTEKSSIDVPNPIPDDISLAEQHQFWEENSQLLDSLSECVTAVVHIRGAIPEETLYLKLRKRNIRIVEIDCVTPLDEDISGVALLEDSDNYNPFVWLSISNIMKMAEIAAKDLIKLFPSDSAIVSDNLQSLKKRYFALKTEYESKFSLIEQFEVVTMDNSFDYLLKDINLFVIHRFASDESEWTKEEHNVFENGLKNGEIHTIIHRWKQAGEIGTQCTKYGAETAVLVTGDPKLNNFDKGLYGLIEKNLSILLKTLKKEK